MDLLSVFKRKVPAVSVAPASEAADAVQLARTRARQRLIGAAVLVVAGIIGFPLLFETQPRPIPVDLPIEIPRKDAVAPLNVPSPPPATVAPTAALPAKVAPPAERVIVETQAEAGREVAASAAASASATVSAAPSSTPTATSTATEPAKAVASEPAKAKPTNPPSMLASAPPPAAPVVNDGARARALLEGQPTADPLPAASAAATARFVVQVGAFTDANALKEARAKVERLGMKTYTQVAETPAGPRTRVRVGPFATRDEAERAAAKIKAAALPAAILSL